MPTGKRKPSSKYLMLISAALLVMTNSSLIKTNNRTLSIKLEPDGFSFVIVIFSKIADAQHVISSRFCSKV